GAGLRIGGDAARVVVRGAGNQPGAEQMQQAPPARMAPQMVPPPKQHAAGSEKIAQQVEEYLELFVMGPMTGALDGYDAGILEVLHAAVVFRVRRPALLAVDQQRRAADPAPQLDDLVLNHTVRRVGADVIVEFPAVGAVLVLV